MTQLITPTEYLKIKLDENFGTKREFPLTANRL